MIIKNKIASQLHRAQDKIRYQQDEIEQLRGNLANNIDIAMSLQMHIQELEEEIATLQAEKNELAMYPEHYHEEKHTAFKLGEAKGETKFSDKWAFIGLVTGGIVGIVIMHLIHIGVIW